MDLQLRYMTTPTLLAAILLVPIYSALNMPHLTSTGCRQDAGIVERPGRHNSRRPIDREALRVRDKQLLQLQLVLLVL